MSANARVLWALTRFEARRGMARQGAWMGLAIFVAAVAIGAYDYHYRNGDPATLFGEGFIIWMMGLITFGLAIDRRRAFDAYLIHNHTNSGVYIAAKAVALTGLIVGAGMIACAVRIAATGDVMTSVWSAAMMTLIGLMVAPFAMMVESQADTSMPAAIVVLGYGVVGMILFMTRQSTYAFELTGLAQAAHGDFTSLAPLATRTGIVLLVGYPIAAALTHLRLRRY